jgi:hypothetical protein
MNEGRRARLDARVEILSHRLDFQPSHVSRATLAPFTAHIRGLYERGRALGLQPSSWKMQKDAPT